jgi:hypothetical protein
VMPRPVPRTYLVAGTLEPFFLENATRWAVALRDAGADVVIAWLSPAPGPDPGQVTSPLAGRPYVHLVAGLDGRTARVSKPR